MFCPNCGTKLSDGTVFCSNCGVKIGGNNAPQQSQQTKQPQQPQQPQQPPLQQPQPQPQPQPLQYQPSQTQYQPPQAQYQQPMPGYGYPPPVYGKPKKKTGLAVGVIASLAVVVAVALILIFTLGGGTGASSPADAVQSFLDAVKDLDYDAMTAVMSDFVLAELAQEFDLPSDAKRSKIADAMEKNMKESNNYSDNVEYIKLVSFSDIKTVKTVHKSESGFSDYFDEYAYEYGFDEDDYDIEAFADVTFNMNYSNLEWSYNAVCVKINGSWFIAYADIGF